MANTRAGKPVPPFGFGHDATISAPVSGTSERLFSSSICQRSSCNQYSSQPKLPASIDAPGSVSVVSCPMATTPRSLRRNFSASSDQPGQLRLPSASMPYRSSVSQRFDQSVRSATKAPSGMRPLRSSHALMWSTVTARLWNSSASLCRSSTASGRIISSTGSSSRVRASLTKWIGGSTCVPHCPTISYRSTVKPCSSTVNRRVVTWSSSMLNFGCPGKNAWVRST